MYIPQRVRDRIDYHYEALKIFNEEKTNMDKINKVASRDGSKALPATNTKWPYLRNIRR